MPVGLLLLDWDFELIYANTEAIRLIATWNYGPEDSKQYNPREVFRIPDTLTQCCEALKARILEEGDSGVRSPNKTPVAVEGCRDALRSSVQPIRLNSMNIAHPGFFVSIESQDEESPQVESSMSQEKLLLLNQLTPSERELALLVGEGLSNKEIADRLSKSVLTVKKQLNSTFGKLNIGSRARLMLSYDKIEMNVELLKYTIWAADKARATAFYQQVFRSRGRPRESPHHGTDRRRRTNRHPWRRRRQADVDRSLLPSRRRRSGSRGSDLRWGKMRPRTPTRKWGAPHLAMCEDLDGNQFMLTRKTELNGEGCRRRRGAVTASMNLSFPLKGCCGLPTRVASDLSRGLHNFARHPTPKPPELTLEATRDAMPNLPHFEMHGCYHYLLALPRLANLMFHSVYAKICFFITYSRSLVRALSTAPSPITPSQDRTRRASHRASREG